MSILAFIIILLAFCGCYVSYAKYNSALHPIFLYNALWLIVTIVLQINTMEWYPLGNDVYAILLIGLISFDFGGLLIGYGTINKSSIYINTYIEECENDEIDYRKVGNRLLMIQLVLTLISIPLFLRGLSYVQRYGMSVMRNIFANGVEEGYMTAAERILFLHLGIFPAMQTCSFIQVFLWAKGKIKGWNLIASIIDLVIVVVSTVGRWEVFYFALAMLCAYMLNKSPSDSGMSIGKQKKIRRRIRMIIVIAIIALASVTIQRHKVIGNIFESILNIVAGYFCCGPALLQVMLKNPVSSGISAWHWGQAIFGGLLGCINYILQIVTFKRVHLNLYDTQAYAAEFYAVSAHQSMNAYPTWYYYFMQDFGYLGVVLVTAIIAGISVRIYRKAKRNPSINNQLAYFYVLHVILFASVWWELRRSDIVATILHNLWIMPLIGLSIRGKKNGKV
ncbi:O-antigen polymerase [Mediterraneibacter sp. 210702-DFI.5.30]|uniref:O-antigen polymerase n=1 Tax=Mediterraneibacter sp. 210702-DFI.5.30 TaxID=2883232 RepID=UPI001D07F5C0|nr:oligosaccharide repeat unit polymerase [Mediterraneibacter sp. 210702-DFI.5.30]